MTQCCPVATSVHVIVLSEFYDVLWRKTKQEVEFVSTATKSLILHDRKLLLERISSSFIGQNIFDTIIIINATKLKVIETLARKDNQFNILIIKS